MSLNPLTRLDRAVKAWVKAEGEAAAAVAAGFRSAADLERQAELRKKRYETALGSVRNAVKTANLP